MNIKTVVNFLHGQGHPVHILDTTDEVEIAKALKNIMGIEGDQMTVADTILQQIGGNKFKAMTGAKHLADHGNGLSFKLPARFARDDINYCKITLTAADLYDVEYGRLTGFDYEIVKETTGIFADQLRENFRDVTGLDTNL
jgi:hypothetical protein